MTFENEVGRRIERLVRLLFGAPFETPTRSEQAMFLAFGAGLRSSAAGRQVGVVVVDGDGEVLVTGANEAPKARGGQYWAEETPDHRDFTYGHDVNDRIKLQIVADVLARLHKAGWLTGAAGVSDPDGMAQRAMSGPLRGSRSVPGERRGLAGGGAGRVGASNVAKARQEHAR